MFHCGEWKIKRIFVWIGFSIEIYGERFFSLLWHIYFFLRYPIGPLQLIERCYQLSKHYWFTPHNVFGSFQKLYACSSRFLPSTSRKKRFILVFRSAYDEAINRHDRSSIAYTIMKRAGLSQNPKILSVLCGLLKGAIPQSASSFFATQDRASSNGSKGRPIAIDTTYNGAAERSRQPPCEPLQVPTGLATLDGFVCVTDECKFCLGCRLSAREIVATSVSSAEKVCSTETRAQTQSNEWRTKPDNLGCNLV